MLKSIGDVTEWSFLGISLLKIAGLRDKKVWLISRNEIIYRREELLVK